MALLLSQASGDSHVKHLLREQLGEWIKQGVSHIFCLILRLFDPLMLPLLARYVLNTRGQDLLSTQKHPVSCLKHKAS